MGKNKQADGSFATLRLLRNQRFGEEENKRVALYQAERKYKNAAEEFDRALIRFEIGKNGAARACVEACDKQQQEQAKIGKQLCTPEQRIRIINEASELEKMDIRN